MENSYLQIIRNGYQDYFNYVSNAIIYPSWHNYFYWLILISLFFWGVEIFFPWRRKQSIFRKDFWLDGFYMFFNFFIFPLIIFNALSELVHFVFHDLLSNQNIHSLSILSVDYLPIWVQLVIFFLVRDFIHFNIHRLLHRVPFLWEFHKIHHSVKEMGFAAHLRFHWMENVVYRVLEYIPLALIGFSVEEFIIVHLIALAIGHSNHSNYFLPLGMGKYIFNNPQMHIWHHSKTLPNNFGVNFGISLSCWDYLFKTAYVPSNGRDIELGFKGDEYVPATFIGQNLVLQFNKTPSGFKIRKEPKLE